MLALFTAQFGETYLAGIGVISEDVSVQARLVVGVVFLVAAAWVLRKDYRALWTASKEGLRAPWSVLEHEGEKV